MYITETTEKVRKLFEKIEQLEDMSKMKFLLYTFNGLNNNQVNSKNEVNPNLIEDNDLIIFNLESIGFESNITTCFLQYNIMLYNGITKSNDLYEDNGNVMGLTFDENEKKLLSNYEKMSFNEKLDIFSELIIRYDNETYFENKMPVVTFSTNVSGFDIAYLIQGKKVQ